MVNFPGSSYYDFPKSPMDDIARQLEEGFVSIARNINNWGKIVIITGMTKGLVSHIASRFFESDSLPVKTTYVDRWPRTCQQVKECGSKFWSRRVEGATVFAVTDAALVVAWLYSKDHPIAESVWKWAEKATTSCLNSIGFDTAKGSFFSGNDLLPWVVLPSILGLGTSLGLGSYDLISKYFNHDSVLDTKPIFNQTLQSDIDTILGAAISNKEEGSFFQNVLLYGPPGTGKTMVSKWIAAESKMNYIIMSGGDLLKQMSAPVAGVVQAGAGASVVMLQQLIERSKSLSSPTVLFIDEAEAFLGNRDNAKSQELISLLNTFLELTGQPTSKMMLVLATNRPNDLDSAVLSRMDYKIFVGPPEKEERKAMIQWNIDLLVQAAEQKSMFTADIISHIAKQTQGFSGRDLFKLINRLKVESKQTDRLDTNRVDQVVKKFVGQEQCIELQKNAGSPLKSNPFYSATPQKVAN